MIPTKNALAQYFPVRKRYCITPLLLCAGTAKTCFDLSYQKPSKARSKVDIYYVNMLILNILE
jgi:hypothetical protein